VKKRNTILVVLVAVAVLLLAACQPQTVEVTRVVTETVVEEGQTVEVTRVVTETETVTEEVQVEVTREVVEQVVQTARGAGGTLTIIYWQAPSTMNNYLSGGTKETHASSVVWEPLARYDENGNFVPWLAEEVPTLQNGGVSEDLTSITWNLKEGVLWSDGTPLTSADVVFTAEYCMDPDTGCAQIASFAGVESVEAIDDLTVKITFEGLQPFPYGPFVGAQTAVMQAAQFADCMGAAAQECTEQNFNPIGTGPYKVQEFRANDVIIFEVNENYRDPIRPYFSEVILKGGGDAASAARAVLETGEADYAWNLQVEPEILNQMELAGIGKVHAAFNTSTERLVLNQADPDPALGDQRAEPGTVHPSLSDPAVRQALSMAIDRETVTKVGYGPFGQPTCNLITGPPAFVSTANDDCLNQDIDGANALLDEAGWVRGPDGIREKDGVRLSFLYQTSTNSVRQTTQALLKQWWEEIGVETELKNVDASVFFGSDPASPDTYGKFWADIEMYTSSPNGTDLQSWMGNHVCENANGSANNWLGGNQSRYCSEEFDAMYAELEAESDPERRAELIKELQDNLVQNYILVPLVGRGSVSAWRNDLLGVRLNGWDSELWNIADWSRAGG
jgi:peptide/nickel transport system substrate-binding protein